MVVIETKKSESGITIALLKRDSKYEPYIVAWGYSEKLGDWGNGHYFSNIEDAIECYKGYGKE